VSASRASADVSRIARHPDAFEAFYRQHVEEVQRFVARRVDDPYLAADLTADVFLAAIEAAQGYRPSLGTPVAWLFGFARNVVAAERRRSSRERRATGRIPAAELIQPEDLAGLHRRIDAQAEARRLYLAMDRLAPSERAVLELVALDGLTVRESARALAIRPAAARVRLYRARRHMQNELDPGVVDANPRLSEASQ
jgi:RNA polymerase sigma factor (sigma-70 family)